MSPRHGSSVGVRLNKLLAERGVGARRKCDTLIHDGHVRVNGVVAREPGVRVEPERDRVEVDGRPLPAAAQRRYFVLNKPVGVITTLSDPEGRRTIRDLMPPGARLFPVGRLDADTSGLLILTNDGELAHHLMHPRYGVTKVYRVRVREMPREDQLRRLTSGVEFEPGIVSSPARVRRGPAEDDSTVIEIALHEGRHRQVRRMCEAVGLTVMKLHRAAYGPLRLGPLARGMWRELASAEVAKLRAASARPRPREGGAPLDRGRPRHPGRARARGVPPERERRRPREGRAPGFRTSRRARGDGFERREGRQRSPERPPRRGRERGPGRGGPERGRPGRPFRGGREAGLDRGPRRGRSRFERGRSASVGREEGRAWRAQPRKVRGPRRPAPARNSRGRPAGRSGRREGRRARPRNH